MKKLVLALMMTGVMMGPARAYEIVATVNDEVISDYDVGARVKMMQVLLKMPDETAQTKQVKDKILNALIDEKVKIQEGQKENVDLTDEDITHGISYLEQQNQMEPGTLKKLFAQEKINFDTLENQIKADLMWLKVIRSHNEKPPVVTQGEIQAEKNKLKKELIKPAYLLAEIYIPFKGNEAQALAQTQALFDQVVGGTSFPELAAKFSKHETAVSGGDLGWVRPGQMEKALDDVLPLIRAGQMSKPIKGKNGYYLILMREQQKELTSTDVEAWHLSQMIVPKDKLVSVLNEVQKKDLTCAAFNQLAQKEGLQGSGPMPQMIVSRMPDQLFQMTKDIEVGAVKGPINADDFYLFLMKCDSQVISILPTDEDIRKQLEMGKLEDKANDLFKEIKANAVIERKG